MDTVIGLGKAGCSIADKFAEFPQYEAYKLDVGLERTKTSFPLKEHQKIEDYEEKLPSLKTFFKEVEGDVLFVVAGGGKVSSASLQILQYLKKHKINMLYIKPEQSLLNDQQTKLERVVYNVFQEYARSGVFERMYIVSNSEIEHLLGGVTIKNYNEKINEMIVSTIHMINVYNNNDSLVNTFCDIPVGARITTVGMGDLEENEDKMFFSLDNVSDIVYYYAYNKEKLETDFELMSKIKKAVSAKKEEGVRVTYGIFETDYDQDYVYCLNHSSVIQK
jgi:hypothetical protein